jgi:hypothetical protein
MVLERMLADQPFWWDDLYQYNAFVIVILICAAVDGVARIRRWVEGHAEFEAVLSRHGLRPLPVMWALAACAISLALLPQYYLGLLRLPSFYRGDPGIVAAEQAVAAVPSGVVVDAANNVGPALTDRTTVLQWEPNVHDDVPWVVANLRHQIPPFGTVEEQRAQVDELVANGYHVVFARDGYVVLHRPDRL